MFFLFRLDQSSEVCTSSLDHTIKIWDTENGGMKSELVGNKAFFGLSYSRQHKLLLTAGCERTIRMYDPRSTEGVLVKSAYASHQVKQFAIYKYLANFPTHRHSTKCSKCLKSELVIV